MARPIETGAVLFIVGLLSGCAADSPSLTSAETNSLVGALMLLLLILIASLFYAAQFLRHNQHLQAHVAQLSQELSEIKHRPAEERMRALFDHSDLGMGLLTLDRKILQVNPALLRMTGYSEEEIIGHSPNEFVHPADWNMGAELFTELISGRRPSLRLERRYRHKDGTYFWGRLNYSLVHSAAGEPSCILGTLENITTERQALQELRASEERFRATFESSAIGMGLLGLDGRILRANPAVCAISGYTEAELMALRDQDNVYPADRMLDAELMQQLMAGERYSYQIEKRYVRKNGEVFWARENLSLVCGSDGQPLYLIGMLEDIDHQKRMWVELQASEERFRAMFESSAIGIALTTLDGHLLKANAAVCAMSGYTEAELRERTDALNTYAPDRAAGAELVTEILTGRRQAGQLEKRYVRKNGEVFWTRVTLSAVQGHDGLPAYLVAMVEDIEAQKSIWAELQESKARFQAMFENAAVGIALMGLDRRVIAINPVAEKISSYSFEEIRNMDVSQLAVPEDRPMDANWFKELIMGQRNAYTMERRYRRKNGQIYWARINYSLVRDINGQPDYLVGIMEDIDEQKRVAERLAEQEAEYRQMLEQRVAERTKELEQVNLLLQQQAAQEAVVSERTRLARDLHDAVTQTLFSATLIADVLPDIWAQNQPEGHRRLEELRGLTRGALAEMRTLLVELRPNALAETPLSTLLRQLTEAIAGRTRLKIQLNTEAERHLPADVKVALYRIAQEALNNVAKHARATQACVTLRFGPITRLTVIDDGTGFQPTVLTGDHLGLKIMRERAEAIGAKLNVESQLGEGTHISVTWEVSS